MDLKITKKRLGNMLSYDWLKILIVVIAAIFVWSLLFTTTATRCTDGENFYLVVYEGVKTTNASSNAKYLDDMTNEGAFSYDVLSRSVTEISSTGQYSASYMLSLRLSTHEGDVFLSGGGNDLRKAQEEGKAEIETVAQVQYLVNNGILQSIDDLLVAAREYCTKSFITENGDGTYTVNEKEIEKYFREYRIRSARNYKKTYRTEAQITEGVKKEIERIETIYKNYLYITKAIEKTKGTENDFLWYTAKMYRETEGGEVKYKDTKAYGIDLSKVKGGSEEVESQWYLIDKEGKITTDGLVLTVFDYTQYQPDMQYETLSFLAHTLRKFGNYGE